MNKPCKHFEQMQQYLEDCAINEKPWELWELWEVGSPARWNPLANHPWWDANIEYRRKPPAQKYIMIGDVEVPEPLRVAPEIGCPYCVIWAFGVVQGQWYGSVPDLKALAYGLVHLTKEAADLHFEALRKLNNQPGKTK